MQEGRKAGHGVGIKMEEMEQGIKSVNWFIMGPELVFWKDEKRLSSVDVL